MGYYYLSKSHTCHITLALLLQHVLKMSSCSKNTSGRCWHHLPTSRSITVCLTVAHWLSMRYFSLSTCNF